MILAFLCEKLPNKPSIYMQM